MTTKTKQSNIETILFFVGLAAVQFAGNWWILAALATMMAIKWLWR